MQGLQTLQSLQNREDYRGGYPPIDLEIIKISNRVGSKDRVSP